MTDSATAPNASDVLDIAIIGAGPAGLTAGLYAARAGMDAAVFERVSPGGQLAQTEQLENYPGFPEGTEGFALAWSMKQQADRFGVRSVSEEVTGVDLASDPKVLSTPFGTHRARAVIVATGARPRKLGVDGEDELAGRGVSYCATCDGNFFRGKTVAVVGGGNTAAADALYLARICEKVYLIHRRDRLRATAVYHERLAGLPNVEFVWNATVARLEADGDGALAAVAVRDVNTGEERTLAVSGLFVAVGTQPNTEFLGGALELDAAGYIVAGEDGAASVPGVWAAGDVRTKALRQVVTAVADGAVCAEQAAERLSL
ncbi:MAG TPA: thioredoxin-disulfide reductase [Candidatus Aphodovivens avistercoris]|nr:thioredoxin-disulfide reductase [Candidatus Aphodovivens avistercoris]